MNARLKLFVIFGCVVLVFGVLLVFLWWLLTSRLIANSQLAIRTRHYYFLELPRKFNFRSLPFDIIASQFLKAPDGATFYSYILLGKFLSVDSQNQILYVQTNKKEAYGFKYALEPIVGGPVFRDAGSISQQEKTFEDTPFGNEDVLMIQWTDRRSLDQILVAANVDPKKIVNSDMTPSDYSLITKVKQ